MEFGFTVRGDRITADKDYKFIEGNKGYYEAVFAFSDAIWEECTKLCVVEHGEDVYKIPITGGSCLLPEFVKGVPVRIGAIGVDTLDGADLTTRISTNMLAIGVQDGAASKEVTAKLNTAAQVWEKYLADMEDNRKAAEEAATSAEANATAAEQSAESAKVSAEGATMSADSAKNYADSAGGYATVAKNAAEGVENAKVSAEKFASAAEIAQAEAKTAHQGAQQYAETAGTAAESASKSAINANTSATNAKASEESAAQSKEAAKSAATNAAKSEENAAESEQNSAVSQRSAEQALSDLLAMINGGDIVLATNGKLPLSAIPASAVHDVFTVTDSSELTELQAQKGDTAVLVEFLGDTTGEKIITKAWQLLGDDASVYENWVLWGSTFAVNAGYADYANEAVNAQRINGHRLVEMSAEEFKNAVKDEDTYYLVY